MGIVALLVGGCGTSAHVSTAASPNLSPSSAHPPGTHRSATNLSTSGRHKSPTYQLAWTGPTVTLHGTTHHGIATFTALLGSQTIHGTYQWMPVVVQLAPQKGTSQVSGRYLRAEGVSSSPSKVSLSGPNGSAHLFRYVTLIPRQAPTAPVFVDRGLYSGLDTMPPKAATVVLGSDVIQGGVFTVQGTHWTYRYQPAATFSSTSSTPQANSLGGYLGVQVIATPSDWTAQGCQVDRALSNGPASGAGLIGQTQRLDPVGDVITGIQDHTQGWGPKSVTNCTTLSKDLSESVPGDRVTLTYEHRVVFILGHWSRRQVTLNLTKWPISVKTSGHLTL